MATSERNGRILAKIERFTAQKLAEGPEACAAYIQETFEEDAYQDWLADLRHDDPIGFETFCGEGWTDAHWRQKYAEEKE